MAHKRYSNADPDAKVKTWKEIRRWQQERKGKVKDLSLRIGQAEYKQQELLLSTVHELPWWEKTTVGPLEFHFVPAQHWTRRTLTDTNKSLWGGWVINRSAELLVEGTENNDAIYFAGDSGYFQGFRDIGARFPGIRYALMPIGAYEPEWFMGMQHVTPEEAIQAFLDVGAETFIPMHYGAFRLADDTPQEALDRLLTDWRRSELDSSRLKLLKHGETLMD